MRRFTLKYLSGFGWNHCPDSNGMGVRIQMEWVSGMKWNHCPDSRGIGVRNALEYSTKELSGQLGFRYYSPEELQEVQKSQSKDP